MHFGQMIVDLQRTTFWVSDGDGEPHGLPEPLGIFFNTRLKAQRPQHKTFKEPRLYGGECRLILHPDFIKAWISAKTEIPDQPADLSVVQKQDCAIFYQGVGTWTKLGPGSLEPEPYF
jgi:hypothetical protein